MNTDDNVLAERDVSVTVKGQVRDFTVTASFFVKGQRSDGLEQGEFCVVFRKAGSDRNQEESQLNSNDYLTRDEAKKQAEELLGSPDLRDWILHECAA